MTTPTVGVIVAHPDDEVLGCGGTIARLARDGSPVEILVLGEGAASRHGVDTTAEIATLQTQGTEAARLLAATSITFRHFPDNQFDTVPLLHIIQAIETWLVRVTPKIIFTHNPMCLNVDHRLTCQAVLTATRPGTSTVEAVYGFETPSATEWAFGALGHFAPTLFYDVSQTMTVKARAMDAYASEIRAFPHPRSEWGLRARGMYWGSVIQREYAEAFMVLRETR